MSAAPTSVATGSLDDYLLAHEARHLNALAELLAIPSVSALPDHADDVRRCARWMADTLQRAGLEHVRVIETGGHPLVYGDWLHAPRAPTVLVYGHYDVQPVDPIDAWTSPPFAPTVRDGKLFARGATDDKGQLFIHVRAIEAYFAVHGALPINLKLLIEGEEEIGCVHLASFVRAERAMLACDAIVNSDSAMFAAEVPSISCALRGIACFQIDVRGAASDLHSGSYGGAVVNPGQALAAIVAALKDDEGRIAIPGFYDDVRPLSLRERAELAALPFDDRAWCESLGILTGTGEAGYTTLERLWARPSLDINGMRSGFTGDGFKTVIPATASAKLSVRLVPDQDPVRVGDLVAERVEALAASVAPPGAIRVSLSRLHHGAPWSLRSDHPALEAAARAMTHGFGRRPVFTREGGSNPIVSVFDEVLGAPTLMFGIGLPTDNAHAPDEHLRLDNFRRGTSAAARLYHELAALPALDGAMRL